MHNNSKKKVSQIHCVITQANFFFEREQKMIKLDKKKSSIVLELSKLCFFFVSVLILWKSFASKCSSKTEQKIVKQK